MVEQKVELKVSVETAWVHVKDKRCRVIALLGHLQQHPTHIQTE